MPTDVIIKEWKGIRLIVWVWLISCMIKTFTRRNSMINFKDKSSYYNSARLLRRKKSSHRRCRRLILNNIWIITIAALLLQVAIALQQRKMHDVEMIIDPTVDRTRTSEEFKAGKVPPIDQANMKSRPLRNIKILKIKWNPSILLLALQRVLRPLLKHKIHLELSIWRLK